MFLLSKWLRRVFLSLVWLAFIPMAQSNTICELLNKDRGGDTSQTLRDLLPESRNFEFIKRTKMFVPKTQIKDGDKLADYFRKYLPSRFRTEYAREFERVLAFLESGQVTAAMKHLQGAEASYSRIRQELSANTTYANRISPIRLFLDIAHEVRHAITHRVYRPKHKFESTPEMGKDEFVGKNLDPISSDEAISYYEQMILIGRMSKSEYFRPFAAEAIYEDGILRDIAKELAEKKPAPGAESLKVIRDFVLREPAYRQIFATHLENVYDYYAAQPGGIGSINGTEYWY